MLCLNEKDALSHGTTGDPRVDLFYKTVRGLDKERLGMYLEASWRFSPLDTLKILFFTRDTRGRGKGEKKLFYDGMAWLMKKSLLVTEENIIDIPFYGYFKDWLVCFSDTPLEGTMLDMLAAQLSEDWETIETRGKQLSLAWKWTPSENSSFDKKYKLVNKLCTRMHISKKEYRNRATVARKLLNVVEQLMCGRMWEDICFEKVSSVAMNRYKKSFSKHCTERWSKYIERVQKGETKMNVSQLMPNDITSQYSFEYYTESITPQKDVEAQWTAYMTHIQKEVVWKENVLVVLDVSASMFGGESGTPIQVGMALTLIASELCQGPMKNKFMPFSKTAQFVKICGDSLAEKLCSIIATAEVANTNFQAVFDCILNAYEMWSVPTEHEITKLLVITDGQWDMMTDHSSVTHFEAAVSKYEKAGRRFPQILFWNVAARTLDFPTVADQPNTALMSGYSADMMKLIVDGEDVSPIGMLLKAIQDPRYDRISCDSLESD